MQKEKQSLSAQELREAKYRADDAQKTAKKDDIEATRKALEEPSDNIGATSSAVSEASYRASMADQDASKVESNVAQLASDADKMGVEKDRNLKSYQTGDKNVQKKLQIKSVWEELGAFFTPLIGFSIVSMLTNGATTNGMVAMLGMIIFALIGVYFGLKAMKRYKIVSIIMYVWNAVVVLGMLLAVLG